MGLCYEQSKNRTMATVTIPTCLGALGDGSSGVNLSDVLQLTSNEVPNLYSSSPSQFSYDFQVALCSSSCGLFSFNMSRITGAWCSLWRDRGQYDEGRGVFSFASVCCTILLSPPEYSASREVGY